MKRAALKFQGRLPTGDVQSRRRNTFCWKMYTCQDPFSGSPSRQHSLQASSLVCRGGNTSIAHMNCMTAHAGSRTRDTSMGGLCDAATLRALTLAIQRDLGSLSTACPQAAFTVPVAVFVVPGDLRPSGLVRPGPPACICSRGSPGQTASVCLAFQLEGAGRQSQWRFLSYPGTFRRAGGARRASPPRLHTLAGGQSGGRHQIADRKDQAEAAAVEPLLHSSASA